MICVLILYSSKKYIISLELLYAVWWLCCILIGDDLLVTWHQTLLSRTIITLSISFQAHINDILTFIITSSDSISSIVNSKLTLHVEKLFTPTRRPCHQYRLILPLNSHSGNHLLLLLKKERKKKQIHTYYHHHHHLCRISIGLLG